MMDLTNVEDCIYIPITEYNRLKEIENAFILSQAQEESSSPCDAEVAQ